MCSCTALISQCINNIERWLCYNSAAMTLLAVPELITQSKIHQLWHVVMGLRVPPRHLEDYFYDRLYLPASGMAELYVCQILSEWRIYLVIDIYLCFSRYVAPGLINSLTWRGILWLIKRIKTSSPLYQSKLVGTPLGDHVHICYASFLKGPFCTVSTLCENLGTLHSQVSLHTQI